MRNTGETDAKYTERMREKYKNVLDVIEAEGLDDTQQLFDDFIARWAQLPITIRTKESQVLRDLNKQINIFLTQRTK